MFGRIIELIAPGHNSNDHSPMGVVTFEQFFIGDVLHPNFDLPVLRRRNGSNNNQAISVHSSVSFSILLLSLCY